jgi:hypothetical protein
MLDFTYNWLCSVRRFGFTNYVILAGDASTYDSLKSANVRSSSNKTHASVRQHVPPLQTDLSRVLCSIRSRWCSWQPAHSEAISS